MIKAREVEIVKEVIACDVSPVAMFSSWFWVQATIGFNGRQWLTMVTYHRRSLSRQQALEARMSI